jgi:hypothetical protein
LCPDQPSVGPADRLCSDVILPHPCQPRIGQRWNIVPHDGFQSQIAGFGGQDGAHARGEVFHLCAARTADMTEFVGEACPGLHFEKRFRKGVYAETAGRLVSAGFSVQSFHNLA